MTTTTRYADFPTMHANAHIRSSSYDEATNSIACTWTTGASVRRRGPSGYFDELLVVTSEAVNLERLNAGAPLLNAHRDGDIGNVIGSVVPGSARISNGQGRARVALSKAPGDADNVTKIRDGIARNISVGYTIEQIEVVERENDVPIYRVTKWTPLELSAIPVPADPGASFRMARAASAQRSTAALTTLHEWDIRAVKSRMAAKSLQRGLTIPPGGLS